MFDYTEEIRKQSAFVKLLGLSIEKLKNGFCQSKLQIREEFLNKRKIVHGGVIYSMVDISMGVAVYSTLKKGEETATIEIKINYLKPANKKVLDCEAKVIQRGKQIAVIEADIKSDDIMIAKAIGTFSIIKPGE
ncbi:MAG: PaaI family thioesterase [Smithellaceae bacterium]|nr:PaaI family thioesterase [Smithellaceae bacterium]